MTRTRASLLTAISSAALLSAMPLHAQDVTPAAGDSAEEAPGGEENEIVVIAGKLRGEVDAAQPPILELDEQQIAAYGAGSIADLVAALAPQLGSGSGRGSGPPVFLINGMRVSSFREMRSYPPEAIQKVEILPEEVAQKYGYSADQRLINFILKDGFSSRELEGQYGQPGAGGTSNKDVEATYLKIAGPSRLNLNLDWKDTSLLTEAERGVVQSVVSGVPGDPDPADYRSLVADGAGLEATANLTTKVGDSGGSLSLNGTFERDNSLSLSGLNTVRLTDPDGATVLRTFGADDPLKRRSRTDTVSFGSTLNMPLGNWQLTGTVDAGRVRSESEIDRYADTSALVAAAADGSLDIEGPLPAAASAGFDTAKTVSDRLSSLVTVIGSPFYLPAGDVSLTLDSGYSWNRIQSSDTRNPGLETSLIRGDLSAGFNLGVPIASRRDDVMSWLGDFNLNFTAGVDQLSDFGTLTDWSAGLTWGLTETLNIQANYIARDAAPSLSQLGSPEIVTLNVPIYDLSRGETVLASVTSGGNPNLIKEKQRDIRVGAFWELPFLDRSNVSVEYVRNRSSDVSASFPLLTPGVEAAFPDRVTRDSSGQLIAIDQRPVTFDSQNSSRVKFGLNLSGQLGKASVSSGGGGGGFFGAMRAATGGQRSNAGGTGPASGAATPGQGGPGGFDPARFAEMRQTLCAEGAPAPDLSALPERMQENLRGADGKVDPEKLAQFKQRVCSTDAGPGSNFDPARFAEFRQTLCAEGAGVPDISTLPEQMQTRLRGDNGEIDPAKLAELKQRVCSADGAPGGRVAAGGPPEGGPPPSADGPPPGGGGGGARGGRGGGRGGPGGGDGRGRWFANLSYTLELENQVLIAEGLPVLDLLNGDALSGGGVVRNSAQLGGGMFYRGFGTRISGQYSGPSRIDGTGLPGSSDLHFGSLATLDLRFFADLGQQQKLVEKMPFLKGSRISFNLGNVFDTYRKVTDENGDVPLRYQPALIDPQGRTFEIEFRKLF